MERKETQYFSLPFLKKYGQPIEKARLVRKKKFLLFPFLSVAVSIAETLQVVGVSLL